MSAKQTVPKYVVEEFWLIRDDKVEEFVDYYRNTFIEPIQEKIPGFRGWEPITQIPLHDGEDMPADAPFYAKVGAPERLIVEHPGCQLDGVLTHKSVNLHSLIRNEYNLVLRLYFETGLKIIEIIPKLNERWEELHGVSVPEDKTLQKEFYGRAINHWDVLYRVLDNTLIRP